MTESTASPPPPPVSYRLIGIVCAVAGVLCFSLRPVLIKAAYEDMQDPVTLIALRMAVALPFFLAMSLWSAGRGTALTFGQWWRIALLGFIGYYLASFLDFTGLQYVSAGLGRLLLFLYPTLVVLLSAAFLKRPIRARDLIAVALTYGGIALVVSHAMDDRPGDLLFGASLIFVSALAYAIYLIAGAEMTRKVGSFRFTAYATSVACFFCIAQFFVLRPLTALDLPVRVYGLSLVIGTVCTVIPIFLTAEGLRRIGATQVSVIGGLGPISAYVLGFLFLGEALSLYQLGGAILVVAGVLLVTLKPGAR